MYKVAEKFVSINGEGLRAGELAVFIRFKGCNLSCDYCDTKWAMEDNCEFEYLTKEEIYNYIKNSKVRNVTLTGGEPLIQKNINELINYLLADSKLRVEIESNGSIDLTSIDIENKGLSLTVDYKSKSSKMNNRMDINSYSLLTYKDSIKIVVSNRDDLEDGYSFLKNNNLMNKTNILFSPVYNKIQPLEIVEFMKEKNIINGRIQLQLHKFIWSYNTKGV